MMLKQLFDRLCAFWGLLLLSPILILVAILVYFKLGSPILFTQIRPGYLGKPFKLYKFRTMLDTTNKRGELLSDAERLTSFGQFLRASSLDELPELWNVLNGDMSLVGPRPLLMDYLPLFNDEQKRRHDVRPGITGWAQINGRNAQTWSERFKLDNWYVDNISMLLDLKILWLTISKVFRREGIHAEGHATMERFMGNE